MLLIHSYVSLLDKNSIASRLLRCAPAMVASKSDFDTCYHLLRLCCCVNGTSLPVRYSGNVWTWVSSHLLQSGQIYVPFLGVNLWGESIAYAEVSRAKDSVSPGADSLTTTSAISSRESSRQLKLFGPGSSFWRMSRARSAPGSRVGVGAIPRGLQWRCMSPGNWNELVTSCLCKWRQRVKLAFPTKGQGSSSSPSGRIFFPTPRASDGIGSTGLGTLKMNANKKLVRISKKGTEFGPKLEAISLYLEGYRAPAKCRSRGSTRASSTSTPRPRLSPLWVAQVMGLDPRWVVPPRHFKIL